MIVRDALKVLEAWKEKDVIKVITGIRRCGKSTLLAQFQETLLRDGVSADQVHAFNFEDPDLAGVTSWQTVWEMLKPRVEDGRRHYIFLDEVQRLEAFERLVDGLYTRKKLDVYITGSNAFLLSGELATYLSGRYVEIHLTPLSFKEFSSVAPVHETRAQTYARYLTQSGFPYALQLPEGPLLDDYLSGIFNTVLLKDVVGRYGFKDLPLLERVTRFLFDNIGNPTSILRLCNAVERPHERPHTQTVERYLHALCEGYVLHRAPRYDLKGKDLLRTNAKYYLEDVGLRRILLGTRGGDLGHLLENVIYLELCRRHREVYVGALDAQEVDFVAIDGAERTYYQVALTVRDERTLQRELQPLRKLADAYPKVLLTLDEDPEVSHDGIRQINALDFLLA